ncbi:MAG TPA: RidA family protein [Verrucomicrobiae bacterium]|jgi:enamine deaminase RidA (YjgF/YER057c/UK114 family)|nr:RidA family protein [Verrucomicrobiae bacterium]
MSFELLNPSGLERPVGYAHVAKVTSGKIVFIAGQAPFDSTGAVVGRGDFVRQFTQVMANLKLAVEGAGGRPDQIAVMTMYLTDLPAYLEQKKALGAAYREVFGKHFPAITLVEVQSLYNTDCMVEISAVAVID